MHWQAFQTGTQDTLPQREDATRIRTTHHKQRAAQERWPLSRPLPVCSDRCRQWKSSFHGHCTWRLLSTTSCCHLKDSNHHQLLIVSHFYSTKSSLVGRRRWLSKNCQRLSLMLRASEEQLWSPAELWSRDRNEGGWRVRIKTRWIAKKKNTSKNKRRKKCEKKRRGRRRRKTKETEEVEQNCVANYKLGQVKNGFESFPLVQSVKNQSLANDNVKLPLWTHGSFNLPDLCFYSKRLG